MSKTYAEIREMVVQGVIRAAATIPKKPIDPPPLDRVRAVFDASFFSLNSQVSEAFAADNNKRELLRVAQTLTFTAGTATLPTDVLKKFIQDATFTTTPATGEPQAYYGFRRYPDFIRGCDPRLGAWTQIGESLMATTPATIGSGAVPLTGNANFSSINSPTVPATEDADYDVPEDFVPDFIAAMTQYILGQTLDQSAETA